MKVSLTLLSVVAAASLVSAKTSKHVFTPAPPSSNIVPNTYIIEYKAGYSHSNVRNAIANHNISFKVKKEFDIFNGASIQVHSDHSGATLAKIPGIKSVTPVAIYSPPKAMPESTPVDYNSPQLTSAHNLTGVTQVHAQYGYTGKGVKVGIVDSGIDYTHPALGGCFGPKCRVRWGWDFVGDAYDGTNTPIPDPDPMDNCQGHGTHVAGIIGANALNIKGPNAPLVPFVGVAPEVHFGAYRIFGCVNGAPSDIVLQAMERAKADGMNIINLSLGGGPNFKNNPIATLADTLIQQGVHVIVSAGNDGSSGISTVSDAGLSDLGTSVASFDNTAGFYLTLKFGSKTYPYLPSLSWNQPIVLPKSATLVPIVDGNGNLVKGCDPSDFTAFDATGKVVLLAFDLYTCGPDIRATNALNAGAVGVLFSSREPGMDTIGAIPNFPVATVETFAANAMKALALAVPTTTFTWNTKTELVKVGSGGVPSPFSSWGLDPELRQKPDLSAPGGKIYSTYPLAKGGYLVMSGTSMAAPYVVGSHALYIQAKNKLSRSDTVRDVFKNTARNTHDYNSTSWVSTAKQGAGMINVLAAIQTTTSILPAKIDLLDSDHFVKTGVFTLKNHGNVTETYTLFHQSSDSVNSYAQKQYFPSPVPVFQKDHAMVHFDKKTVTLKPGYSTKITVTFDLPTTGDPTQFPIYSGFITVTPATVGNVPVHVPYAGMLGSVAKIPIQDTAFGTPVMSSDSTNGMVIYTRNGQATADIQFRVYDSNNTFIGFATDRNSGAPFFGQKARMLYWKTDGTMNYDTNYIGKIVASKDPSEIPFDFIPGNAYTMVVASQRVLSAGVYPDDFEVYNLGTVNYTPASQ